MPTASFLICVEWSQIPQTHKRSASTTLSVSWTWKPASKESKNLRKTKNYSRSQDMVLSFYCRCYQVTSFCSEGIQEMFLPSFISWSAQTFCHLPILGKPFSATAIPPQQGGQLHTRLTPTSSLLHELQSEPCSASALPLPIQLKHKKQHQKNKHNEQWAATPLSTANDISLCSTSHKTVLNMLQEKARSQITIPQWKRATENKVIPPEPQDLGTVRSLFSKSGGEPDLCLFHQSLPIWWRRKVLSDPGSDI